VSVVGKVIEIPAAERRHSNESYRKLDLEDRVVLFLTRMRRKTPFKELGYQYGCGRESARRYFNELVNIFNVHLLPRLVFPRPPEEIAKMSRKEVLDKFPDLLGIIDGTCWEQFKPENFLENRLSYSAYKHENVFQVLLGEALMWFCSDCAHQCSGAVVSSERPVLFRSEIFGGLANEISVLLDGSSLVRDLRGMAFGLRGIFILLKNFRFQPSAT
jgi:hypothetical protein